MHYHLHVNCIAFPSILDIQNLNCLYIVPHFFLSTSYPFQTVPPAISLKLPWSKNQLLSSLSPSQFKIGEMVSSSKYNDSDQVSVFTKAKPSGLRQKRATESFIGVRERKWGRWVSEIRVPHDQKRIWLGSYDTPEKAARAYDAAVYCLRGPEGVFNFPTEERPKFTEGLSSTEIKAVAAKFASPNCMSELSSSSSSTTSMNSPGVSVKEDDLQGTCKELCETCKVSDSHLIADAGISGSGTFWNESFLLDELFTVEPDSIWAILEETEHFGDTELYL